MNKDKEPLIKHEMTTIEELRRTILKNSGKDNSINESLSLKDRLKQPLSYKYDWIIRQLPKGNNLKILDVGCWTGMMSYLLDKSGHDVTALDKREVYINKLKEQLPNITTIISNIEDVTLSDNHYDAIIASQVIEHTESDNKALYNMYKALVPSGRLIMTVPIEKNLLSKNHKHFYNFYDLMDLFDKLNGTYTISKLNKFNKYDRPKNLFGVVFIKGEKDE